MAESEKTIGPRKKFKLKKNTKLPLLKKKPKTNVTEIRNPDDLQPHPKQSQLFDDTSAEAFADLVNNIDENGIVDPIEILPNGTIISGHRRTRAARRLGLVSVPVLVRHDLAEKGDAAIEQRMIETNLDRRQFSPLQLARLYKRMRELEPAGSQRRGRGCLRDEIGKRLNVSGKTLDRYLPLLDGPPELQHTVDRGFPLKMALDVLRLPKQAVVSFVKDIANGLKTSTLRKRAGLLLVKYGKESGGTRRTIDPNRALRDMLLCTDKLAAVPNDQLPKLRSKQLSKIENAIELLTKIKILGSQASPAGRQERGRPKLRLKSAKRSTAA